MGIMNKFVEQIFLSYGPYKFLLENFMSRFYREIHAKSNCPKLFIKSICDINLNCFTNFCMHT